ncbi:MAG: M48 family metallopeptidase [Minisyncoccia bacterium]
MASLYTEQEKNIWRTYLLFSVFLIFSIGFGWFFSYYFNNVLILWGAVISSIFTSLISYWNSDKIALALSRAIPVKTKEENPYLWNMVENLCITAGLPMPRIYIIPEKQINAFATGRNPKNAAIAVTQGAIEKLENEELEGVLAHELAHIGNRDILVSTVAVVLAGIISILADFFFRMMFWDRRDRNSDSSGGILVLVGLIFAVLAPISATLIQLAISRKREFLADATGALLTRYPEGLARALEKIQKDYAPMNVASDATAHLWISNPFKKSGFLHKLFMTHPPIEERIKILRGMNIN